jgi:hypothetical protein
VGEDGRYKRFVLAPDWRAALAWVHFEGIRAGRLPAVTRRGPSSVEPVWDALAGPPLVAAFRARVGAEGGAAVVREIPRAYLRPSALDAVATLVTRGVLRPGDAFRWTLHAIPTPDDPSTPLEDDAFALDEVAEALALGDAPLAPFLERATFVGPDPHAAHVPVFVPRQVLDEAEALARAAGDVETGGVLIGRLHRDADDLFVEITAQIPARHTLAEATRLTFTNDTWAAVRDAIALRGGDERLAGWWHHHPGFCRIRGCPPERRRTCSAGAPFFSAEDVHLHTTCFPAGQHVALLVSEAGADGALERTLFGWWEGMVVARGFHVLGGTTHATNTTD